MFDAGAHESQKDLKDTDKVESIGEGPNMQPIDDQPSEQSTRLSDTNQQPVNDAAAEITLRQPPEVPPNRTVQLPERTIEGAEQNYRGASEQIPLVYPHATYQQAPEIPAPGRRASGPVGSYPPRPEYYQNTAFGQPPTSAGSTTRPFTQLPPDPYAAPRSYPPSQPTGQPGYYGPSAMTSPASFGQSPQAGMLPAPGRPTRSGLRTGTLLGLGLLIAAIFATGLFAGWQFGHTNNNATTGNSPTAQLQQGNNSNITVPQLTGNNAIRARGCD